MTSNGRARKRTADAASHRDAAVLNYAAVAAGLLLEKDPARRSAVMTELRQIEEELGMTAEQILAAAMKLVPWV
ncbi:MAG: hypothetical protein ACT443_08845 [Gemmatimonadota bacterium]